VINPTNHPAFLLQFVINCTVYAQKSGAPEKSKLQMLAQTLFLLTESIMTNSANSEAVTYAKAQGVKTAAETGDRIEWVKLSLAFLRR